MRASLFALAASVASVTAVHQGFNYGSTQTDGSFKSQKDFQDEFTNAKNLVGASGFTSARLYTMVQGGTTSTPTEAIPAAISAGTTLLLGLWASGGQDGMTNEINALTSAIALHGTSFTSIVAGISVGSEDLYRVSPTGIAAKSGYGADPDTLVSYISQVRAAIKGTGLSAASIGHVDTWTAWVNGSNSAVVSAVDWVGMDAYPYFQSTEANSIEQGPTLFNDALSVTRAAAQGKDVWVTETGWPVSGSTSGSAVPSLANAKTYWDLVGCPLFGTVNTYWFTMQDASPTTPNPSFGLVGSSLTTTPLYDLSCSNITVPSSSASSPSATAVSATSATGVASTSSVAVVATSAAVSGGGLSPTLGNGIGSQVAPSGTVSPVTTASSNGSVVVPTMTTVSGSVISTVATIPSTPVATTSSTLPSSSVFSAGGAQATGSFFGLVGAAIAVAAVL